MKITSVFVVAFLGLGTALAAERPGDPQRGKIVYNRYCLSCHGVLGNGEGEFAEWISPKPRDYRQGTFKWRSTPSGSLPTDADLEKTLKRGRSLYVKYKCAQCHGDQGQGDGPSAHELKDDWGNPIVPYNLTEGHIKCGDTAADIYRVFITGLDGTPMPSFA